MEPLHHLLMSTHLLFQKALVRRLRDTGLTVGQPKVLDYLREHDGSVQKDIAAACHIEPGTLTSLLSGMEKAGLVERRMENGNRRSLYVYLTPDGHMLATQVAVEFKQIEQAALNGISDSEAEQLLYLLARVKQNMEEKESETN
ncbi:MAG: MarR family transcriptional regulator [Lachnospiraceae bacterium]|nr:MarR family transcriptional regulator [Lachnospiraceae bacterium]